MATRQLPANPSLKSLKNQAKQLLHGHQSGAIDACERIRAFHPRLNALASKEIREAPFALADALLVIAREYGYESWPQLLAEQFSHSTHFANDAGWEWLYAPDLWHPIGTRGTISSKTCPIAYENNRENRALSVHVAVGNPCADRELRAIGFDEEAHRHVMRRCGSAGMNGLTLHGFELPYDEVPWGAISYIGIEGKMQ